MAYELGERAILASRSKNRQGEAVACWWVYRPDEGDWGVRVMRTDKYGQRWTLDVPSNHYLTQEIAARALRVSLMSVNRWVKEGRFGKRLTRNGVSVIPSKEVLRMAKLRGVLAPTD